MRISEKTRTKRIAPRDLASFRFFSGNHGVGLFRTSNSYIVHFTIYDWEQTLCGLITKGRVNFWRFKKITPWEIWEYHMQSWDRCHICKDIYDKADFEYNVLMMRREEI